MENERLARVEEKINGLHEDMKEVRSDVKLLLAFKWKIIGVSAVIAFVTATFIEMAKAYG